MNREQRQKEWLAQRAKPAEKKIITYPMHVPGKNTGLRGAGEIEVTPGICPCVECGHEFMWECEEADCKCCTSVCN